MNIREKSQFEELVKNRIQNFAQSMEQLFLYKGSRQKNEIGII